MEDVKNQIEAIIFISDAPVRIKEISEFLGHDQVLIKEN